MNRRTKQFREMFSHLPLNIQDIAREKYKIFLADPNHPSLRRHELGDGGRGKHLAKSTSVSITMQYRAIYVVDGETNVWYWCGSHSSYNIFTGSK